MTGTTALNELYATLSPAVRDQLRPLEETLTLPAGATLISQNVVPEHVMFIEEGSVEITVATAEKTVRLSIVANGKVLGLRAILAGALPEIQATALSQCRIVRIPKKAFFEIVDQYPELYLAICRVLSADLNTAERFLREAPRTPPRKRTSSPDVQPNPRSPATRR